MDSLVPTLSARTTSSVSMLSIVSRAIRKLLWPARLVNAAVWL